VKKFASILLVAVIALASVVPVAAQESASLTDAVKLAKSLFSTEAYTQFRSSQEMYNGKTTYYLYWSEDQTTNRYPAYLTVQVDAERMLVTGYNYQPGYKEESYKPLPALSKDDCLKIAEVFAVKLAPQQFAQMKLEKVEEPQIRLEKRSWALSYTFRYVHYVNGIAFPANNLNVRVNADSGAVEDYYLTWNDYEFPSTEGALSLEEAQDVFKTEGLKLVYLRQYDWRNNTNKPFLAYTLNNGYAMQIDAHTGEITYGSYHVYGTLTKSIEGMGIEARDSLTPWELQEIDLVAGLLTVEQISAIAQEIMGLPKEALLRSSRLMEDKSQNMRFWNLDWEYADEEYYYGASARLNAASGEIQYFYFWEKASNEKIETKLTYEEALTLAKQFLEKWVPAKFADTDMTSEFKLEEGQPLPHAYSFVFERRVNGLPVVGDSINILVQHDKRITNLNVNWYEGEFPSAEDALTAEEMNDIFLKDVGLKLEYVLNYDNTLSAKFVKPTVKLVYKTNEASSYNFDPFTGKNIDYQGKEIVEATVPEYSDIAGHWAEADIARLVELKLLRAKGPEFKPDEAIKLGDLLQILADAAGYQDPQPVLPLWLKDYSSSPYASALAYGVNHGVIREIDKDIDPETLVTREMFAYYLARMQGYSNAAALKGIWTAPYSDFSTVSAEYQGSVAITNALGLLGSGAPGKFMPKDNSTRAQVAVVLARMLSMTH